MKRVIKGVMIALATFVVLCCYWGTFAAGLIFAVVKEHLVIAIVICIIYLPAAALALAIMDRIEEREYRRKRKVSKFDKMKL